ncbi:Trypanosome variant surface glycoprotein C-terminal domain containing protein, putative [Trypanosoma equiperdum]|uniref:Trypanosome variant surface glycoprotein C-terminal domain containing protein, putative n=1 Tax=Trypanosoma equiperdum TaxID=5694 RepID=A0A1G4HZK1_TRYEQ|nr:Trypanosome variant surface glycoprotein C-terminal domain containing protein, putative [Trypanosoma equiperdum]
MEEAAQAIKAAEQAAAQKTELLAKLTLLNTTLANLAKAAMEAQAAARPTTERAPQQADTKTAEDQEKVCNAAGNDENKCKELESQGCKYDENKPAGQKCTLKKEVKEKLEKEAKKDGATATTVKCSEYGSQDKCEEVNKGKDKPVCGWRSGKDNEDDNDAKKYRNGSFLASKQFALIAVVFDCLVAF